MVGSVMALSGRLYSDKGEQIDVIWHGEPGSQE